MARSLRHGRRPSSSPGSPANLFVWAGWRGFGFRLWVVEVQVYFYHPSER